MKTVLCIVIAFCAFALTTESCQLSGITYDPLDIVLAGCHRFKCIEGAPNYWQTLRTTETCKICTALEGSYITTFDSTDYAYTLNSSEYELAQKVLPFSNLNPMYYVRSLMNSDGSFSSFVETEFRLSQSQPLEVKVNHSNIANIMIGSTSFTVSSGPIEQVNIGGTPYDLFAGLVRNDECVVLLGMIDLSVKICPEEVQIRTSVANEDNLAGLCGYFNANATDDFTDFNGIIQPLADFVGSWEI